MACAFPSWKTTAPNSFISDEDLFFDDLLDGQTPFLSEAPAPPRDVFAPVAVPLLPLFAPEKPKKQQRRRSSGKKRRSSKPMTPISESPEVPE